MIEAVIVLPVLFVFLGLFVWTSHSYGEKLREQTETRSTVLYFGSNSCERKRVPAYPEAAKANVTGVRAASITDPTAEPGPQMGSVLARLVSSIGGFLKGATGQSWDMAGAHAQGVVNGATVIDGNKAPLSRTVHADSFVGCNEIVRDGMWSSLSGVVTGMAARGGGLF